MKKISTVVTVYNHRDYIAQALDSALAQKGPFEHEILVSDDGSTDGTREVVRDYAARHPELIKDISTDVNKGISGNLKYCFEHASGEFVAILEGDDYWTDEHKLAKQLAFLDVHAESPMVFSRIRLLKNGRYELLPRHNRLPELLDSYALLGCECMNPICNFSCCLFRARYLRVMPEVCYEGRLSEVTVAFFMAQIGPIGFIRECLSDYRIHENGVFAGAALDSQRRQAIQTFETAAKVADFACKDSLQRVVEDLRQVAFDDWRVGHGGPKRLSIVTVTYNDLEGLKRTAASVAEQTWRDFEWVVIDGGSTDGTREYLETMASPPNQWVSERDNGIYDAINKGIARSVGDYMIAMNGGDVFSGPDVLARVFANNLDADVVYGNWTRVFSDHREFCQSPVRMPPLFFFLENICHQAMFVRTRLLRESPFDTNYYIVADWSKWRHFMLEGRTFQYVPVTVCDFEAEAGLSAQRTHRNVLDLIRFHNEFPAGVRVQALEMKRELGVLSSRTYRLAKFLRWLPMKVVGGWKCLHEHGWRYTWSNFKGKVRRRIGRRGGR